jgi:hypothetical protein
LLWETSSKGAIASNAWTQNIKHEGHKFQIRNREEKVQITTHPVLNKVERVSHRFLPKQTKKKISVYYKLGEMNREKKHDEISCPAGVCGTLWEIRLNESQQSRLGGKKKKKTESHQTNWLEFSSLENRQH